MLLAHHPGANVVTLNAGWVEGESSERPRRELLVYLAKIEEDVDRLDPGIEVASLGGARPAQG